MVANSSISTLLRATLRLDRPQVPSATALRNALGVAVPLALGLAVGQVLIGLTLAIGALNVAFSDHSDPYPLRARRMLLAGLAVGLGIADALARGLGLPRGYWVPLTVAFVLKPDFSATLVRDILRVGGTLLGLAVATVVVLLMPGNAEV